MNAYPIPYCQLMLVKILNDAGSCSDGLTRVVEDGETTNFCIFTGAVGEKAKVAAG